MKNLLHFIEHSLSGTSQIFVITVIAIALHYIVKMAELTENQLIVYGLKGAEYLLFVLDLIIFATTLLKSFKKLIREIWNS